MTVGTTGYKCHAGKLHIYAMVRLSRNARTTKQESAKKMSYSHLEEHKPNKKTTAQS